VAGHDVEGPCLWRKWTVTAAFCASPSPLADGDRDSRCMCRASPNLSAHSGCRNRARQSEMAGTKTNAFVPRTAMTGGDDEAPARCLAAKPCTRKSAKSAIAPTAAKKRTSFQVRFAPGGDIPPSRNSIVARYSAS